MTARRAIPTVDGAALTTVILDMGGVVIPTLFELTGAPGLPGGPFARDGEYKAVERGVLQERDYWRRWSERRPELDIATLWRECRGIRAEMRGLITQLTERVRLVAFTNDMAHWFGADWPRRFPELVCFDAILEAASLGVLKPDPQAFAAAAETLGEDPSRCLFVDDLPANLSGARAVGMHTLLFDVLDPEGSAVRIRTTVGLADGDAPVPGRVFRLPPAPDRARP
ncbi:HAD-IA family hydrolase [Pseudonocardia asaccharolytica]|uniref:Haloacid dehalogenase n=1 Tax=Pseudonocardia asaccharolytica DSM 44247 = NBRC 16224 TaxID=1123024 RepID=A0A511CY88_9PSEU|nr:HAD-IA family hydrolase [Pseudonocardia asaccharolytica]GEL17213.1 haloacid dehalogenase [Pseudonocardia asaccharolytica DSM 44247 = NBRC 16224]